MTKNKAVRITAISFSIICIIMFVYLLYNVISHENSYRPVSSDAIVVLGHSIDTSDSAPDEWLTKRLEIALDLFNENYAPKIIVSGGRGPGDSIAVADAMAKWFLDNGVDKTNILIETRSNNTGENFEFTKKLADTNGIQTIIIVTNDFHMYRAMITAKDYFSEISGRSADLKFDFNKLLAYLKEPLSIMKYKGLHIVNTNLDI